MSKRKIIISAFLILALVFILAACDTAREYTLKIDVEGEGTITPAPGPHKHKENETVDLTVKPVDKFLRWEGDPVATVDEAKGLYKIAMTGDKEIKAVFGEKEDPGEDENVLKFDIANTAYWDFGGNHTRDPEIEIFEEGDKKGIKASDMQSDGDGEGGIWVRYNIPDGPMDLSEYDKIIVEFKHTLGWPSYFQFSALPPSGGWGIYEVDGDIDKEAWGTLELITSEGTDVDWGNIQYFVIQAYSAANSLDLYISSITAIKE